jgi:uncharacterized protein
MKFEWDEEKAKINIAKHGISFSEAATVFGDPLSIPLDDPDHSYDEKRFLLIGQSSIGSLLIVSYTEREERIRIISARDVTRSERKFYEEAE